MSTQSPAAVQLLWQALERNADWIAEYISISRSVVVADYLKWFFERLKDRVPVAPANSDLIDKLGVAVLPSIPIWAPVVRSLDRLSRFLPEPGRAPT